MARIALTVIVGTRPEAIKLAPVVLAARRRPDVFSVRIVRTGQHLDLLDPLMQELGLEADVDLRLMQPDQGLAALTAESVRGLADVLARQRPDWVLVQGDTTTAFAGALAAFYNGVCVAHVEAGLRTGHRRSPYPEEMNRRLIASLADLHFAPTPRAEANLLAEGIAARAIVLSGNTIVDALLQTLERSPGPATHAGDARRRRPYVLVTAHRRENQGTALRDICDGLAALLERHPELEVWIPVHPNPRVRDVLVARLAPHEGVRLLEPLGYTAFVHALSGAALVLTDSGGVQEECAALGKPVLVMREHTERGEAVDAGVAVLVGTSPERIADVASLVLEDGDRYRAMARPTRAFGEGTASSRILDALAEWSRAAAAPG